MKGTPVEQSVPEGDETGASGQDVECAISLKEAARRLGLSYQTVYEHRHEIAFRIPGCAKWLVWPSRLAELSRPRSRVVRLEVTPSREADLPPRGRAVFIDSVLSARQAEKELDELLARALPGRRRKNSAG